MEDRLSPLQGGFRKRARMSRLWAGLAYTLPRNRLMVLLALVPTLALALAIAAWPRGLGEAATDPENVRAVFARFISAMATVATIAVSVAALVLGRELKGIRGQDERHRTNLRFRDDIRRSAGRRVAPMAFAPFLAMAIDVVGKRAREAREAASAEDLSRAVEGVPLGDFLGYVEESARAAAARVERERRDPNRLLTAALDFEQEVTHHLARAFAREDALPAPLRESMKDLAHAIRDVAITTRYAKTLGTQWGLSRMCSAVLLTTIPAVISAAGLSLLYDQYVVDALGTVRAGLLVSAVLGIVMLPLTAVVSHLLRFVFVNQHTLPAEDFVLGPERPDVSGDDVPSGMDWPGGRAGAGNGGSGGRGRRPRAS